MSEKLISNISGNDSEFTAPGVGWGADPGFPAFLHEHPNGIQTNVSTTRIVPSIYRNFQYNAKHTGNTDESTVIPSSYPSTAPSIDWTKNLNSSNAGGYRVAVGDNYVYVITDDGNTLEAKSKTDGTTQWSASPEDQIAPNGNDLMFPCIAENYVIVPWRDNGFFTHSYWLYAHDKSDGSTVWSNAVDVDNGIPSYKSGEVYVQDSNETVFAYDESDGSTIWSTSTGSAFFQYCVGVNSDYVVVGMGSGDYQVIDRSDGSVLHTVSAPNTTDTETVVTMEDTLAFGSRAESSSGVVKINLSDGSLTEIISPDDKGDRTAPLGINGDIFTVDDGKVKSWKRSDGSSNWTTSDFNAKSATVVGGHVLATSGNGLKSIADSDGSIEWTNSNVTGGKYAAYDDADDAIYVADGTDLHRLT